MNRKKIFGSIAAMVAVLALVAGGTFAAWSDFDEYSNSAGAEHLTLDTNANSGVIGFSQTAMAPGVNREFDFVVASRDGQVVPAADLTIKLQELLGTEDGCKGNSEVLDDGGECNTPGTGNNKGNFIHDARITVNASAPIANIASVANPCNSSVYPRGGRVSSRSLKSFESLNEVNLLPAGVKLAPGEGICVAMGLELPATANNASQGDSATWEFRYDLTQS